MDSKPTRPHRRPPPLPSKTSGVWPVALLVVLCFAALPLFLALSRARPTLSDVSQMGVTVTVHDGEQQHSTLIFL
jgi:hypothetical protein